MEAPLKPVGPYVPELHPTAERRAQMLETLETLPAKLAAIVEKLSDSQLDTKYRNWTCRQIVHHLADSHIHAYTRCKFAILESTPTIKPYREEEWGETIDTRTAPVGESLGILRGVHARWVRFLRSLSESDFEKGFFHPEQNRLIPLAEVLGMYAHHSRHHLGQIEWMREQNRW